MTNAGIARVGNAEQGRSDECGEASLTCPYCWVELPEARSGNNWCWRCRMHYWIEMTIEEPQLYPVVSVGAAMLEVAGTKVAADGDVDEMVAEEFREEIDPDDGIHGLCPSCGERLMVWIEGRCRCEACHSALVVRHRRGGSQFYEWLEDEALFKSRIDRVRMAQRDDLMKI